MAKVSGPETDQNRTATPGTLPQVTPSSQGYTADFTLQGIMDLQKTVAVLCEKVDRLSSDVGSLRTKLDEQGTKVDRLSHWQSRLLGGAAVLAAVVAVVWTILNVVPWDRITIEPRPAISTPATKP